MECLYIMKLLKLKYNIGYLILHTWLNAEAQCEINKSVSNTDKMIVKHQGDAKRLPKVKGNKHINMDAFECMLFVYILYDHIWVKGS